ncbi:MAG: hypothetical protein IJI42_02105 [Methanobrevibacter sp.]|nr:hypothetical protein [Methanobrevibacter sp.]
MARKTMNKVEFKSLNEKQRNAYLSMKREDALSKVINSSDYSITTVKTKRIELTSGKYKGDYEVGKDEKDAKKKLFDALLPKFAKDNELESFAPTRDTVEVNVDKIEEYIKEKGL